MLINTMESFVKQPRERMDYDIISDLWLNQRDQIIRIQIKYLDEGIDFVGYQIADDGKTAKIWIEGGECGKSYLCTALLTTRYDLRKEVDFFVHVVDMPFGQVGKEEDKPKEPLCKKPVEWVEPNRLFTGFPNRAPLTSGDVYRLNYVGKAVIDEEFSIDIPVGARTVVISYPASMRPIKDIRYPLGLNASVKAVFRESFVEIQPTRPGSMVTHRVYTFTPAEPFTNPATYIGVI